MRTVGIVLSATILTWMALGCEVDLGSFNSDPAAAVDITVTTAGTPTDTNGYVVHIERTSFANLAPTDRRVLVNDSIRVSWTDIGVNGEQLEVTLTDVAAPCAISGDSTRMTSANKGRTVPAVVRFQVSCP